MMKISQKLYALGEWKDIRSNKNFKKANLVLAFGSQELIRQVDRFNEIREMFPDGNIVLGSTAGEIIDGNALDDTLAVTAVEFESSHVETHKGTVDLSDDHYITGRELGKKLRRDKLRHVMVFADGLISKIDDIIQGIQSSIPKGTVITGGLTADNHNFKESCVGLDSLPKSRNVVIIGFYGENLSIGYGSHSGWHSKDKIRKITKSKGCVIYELDDQPALDEYKEYLGEAAKRLPLSGLMNPINITENDSGAEYIRTPIHIDETEKSIVLSSEIGEKCSAQFMSADIDELLKESPVAATKSLENMPLKKAELGIIIGCMGRKFIFGQKNYKEIEYASNVLGRDCATIGFRSYGEISPATTDPLNHKLQNQTLTITTIAENKYE